MLELFGIDTAAQDVYRIMLAEPSHGVASLCAQTGLPEAQVREALDALLDAGLLRESREQAGRMHVVAPEIGLELLMRRQEQELARRQQELATSRAAAAELVAEYAKLRPRSGAEGTKRLIGLDSVQAEIDALSAATKREFRAVSSGAAISAEVLEAARPADEALLSRGVAMQVLYKDNVRNDPATRSYARWLTDRGGQVRTAPLLPPRLLVFDGEIALVPIDPSDRRQGALCTREPGIVASLLALFQQAWDAAVPLGSDQPVSPDTGLTVTERELLKLLAGGLTDESAAKRLGVSLSTVRRQMAALMERLEASSRFEAGLKAAQRGWL